VFEELLSIETLILVIEGLIIVVAMLVADRLVRRAISRYAQRLKLAPHVENIFNLIARIVIVAAGMVALLSFLGLPTDWFLGVSALTGAAIGFASTQTVGNFLAGLYIMISRPFMVMDYVKIGNIEGEVREITINYTKIYTPTYNITEIPNRKVLDSIIINYSGKKNIIDYSFEVSFPHLENVTNQELIEECLLPTIEEFYTKHKDILPKKPELSMSKLTRLEKVFLVRMFFPEEKINSFYDVQPELMQDIASNWDVYKAKKKE